MEVGEDDEPQVLFRQQRDVRPEAVDYAAVRDEQTPAVVLNDPAHAVAHLQRLGVERLGGALHADYRLRAVSLIQALLGDEPFAVPRAVAEVEADPFDKIPGAGM